MGVMDRLDGSFPLGWQRAARRSHAQFVSADSRSWLDCAIVAGVLAMVVFSPLAIGAVHPWAFITAELVMCAMTVLWVIKLVLHASIANQPALRGIRDLVLPLGLFIAFVFFQLAPLPPEVLHALSPSTYHFYVKALEGWPRTAPFEEMLLAANSGHSDATMSVAHKTLEDAKPAERPTQAEGAKTSAQAGKAAPLWLPLSIAPSLTWGAALKLTAYAALFFVVLFYPFGPSRHGEAERRFYRYVLIAILIGGLSVAYIGILERFLWNGKILWFFVPYDWGRAQTDLFVRVRGPFVNPDHFAAFLNLVLPIAVAGVLFPTFITRRNGGPFHVFSAVAALMIFIALLLSLSRAGWLGAIVGLSTLVLLASFVQPEKRPMLLRFSHRVTVTFCALMAVGVLACALLFVGGQGRRDVDVRLKQTIKDGQGLDFRIAVWRDTMPMVRDFPLFGVGLGAFEDVFPHYQSPPWSSTRIWEAHNDYLELLSSAGVVGFALLLWFFAAVGRRLYKGLRTLPSDVLPVVAALLAAASAMAVQEFFDFNLQIPANAILFTILLSLVMRLIGVARIGEVRAGRDRTVAIIVAAVVTPAAIALAVLSLGQDKVPYPYNLMAPKTTGEGLAMILSHPASARPHLWMLDLLGPRVSPALNAKELEAAVWDDPTNPGIRDLYARSLLLAGDSVGALRQVTLSNFNSPWLPNHYYLQGKYTKMLLPPERAAVEEGLRRAMARNFHNAVWALGGLYDSFGEYAVKGDMFAQTAATLRDPSQREALLLAAADAHARVGQADKALSELKQAAALNPTDPQPYAYLVELIFAPRKDTAAAKATVKRGIANGADPSMLYLALADAATSTGDPATEEAALVSAVNARPSDFNTVSHLASFYMREKRFDQAVLVARRATEIRPESSKAFYELAVAEESAYQYFAAQRDFEHALELDPHDRAIRAHFKDFQRKLMAVAPHATEPSAP
jgi:O-antigen ligase/tetratricopeptide (TPR) repeat protein